MVHGLVNCASTHDLQELGVRLRGIALRHHDLRRLAQQFALAQRQVYLVGGIVRDILRGVDPAELFARDIDLATDAHPDVVAALLREMGWSVFEVGKRFGTVAAHVNDATYEITTFRRDVYRPHDRHPEVTFSSTIEDDLARRDFTVNSLAMSLLSGPLVDPMAGLADLERKIIRTSGDPVLRFQEDSLRLMRAARFAAQLQFQISPETSRAIRRSASGLQSVSRERIRDEFTKILVSDAPAYGLQLLVDLHLMPVIAPPVDVLKSYQDVTKQGFKNLLTHTFRVVQRTPPDLVVRLAALLHDVGKPQTFSQVNGQVHFFDHERVGARLARDLLVSLRFDGATIKDVVSLVESHMRPAADTDSWSDSAVRRFIREVGEERLPRLLLLARADITSQHAHRVAAHVKRLDRLVERCERLLEEEHTVSPRSPLDGVQIMELTGLRPGPVIGEIKAYLLDEVLEERLAPDDQDRAVELLWSYLREKGIPVAQVEQAAQPRSK
ncbi:MAG: CCA tRNA nucleotidyltransferase [Chloroflexi bacterium]|nr:CCA tRNA nucleotidyltransferase [Chloroflexota bacterium]